MAVALFFIFGAAVIVFGLSFVTLTLRHHRELDRKSRERSP